MLCPGVKKPPNKGTMENRALLGEPPLPSPPRMDTEMGLAFLYQGLIYLTAHPFVLGLELGSKEADTGTPV